MSLGDELLKFLPFKRLIAVANDVAVGVEKHLSAVLMSLPFRHELHVHAAAQEPNDSKFSQRARRKVGKTQVLAQRPERLLTIIDLEYFDVPVRPSLALEGLR